MHCFIKSITGPNDRAIPRMLRQTGVFPFSIVAFDFRERPPQLDECQLLCDFLLASVPNGHTLHALRSTYHRQDEYRNDERVGAIQSYYKGTPPVVGRGASAVIVSVVREQAGILANLMYDYWRTVDGYWLIGDFPRNAIGSVDVEFGRSLSRNKANIHAMAFAQCNLSAISLDDIMLDIYVRQPVKDVRECLGQLSGLHGLNVVVGEGH